MPIVDEYIVALDNCDADDMGSSYSLNSIRKEQDLKKCKLNRSKFKHEIIKYQLI